MSDWTYRRCKMQTIGIARLSYAGVVGLAVVLSTFLLAPNEQIRASETGLVTGVVTDSETGEPLPGAPVKLAGSNIGTTTDANGRYFLLNIRPGTYDLQYRYVGYRNNLVIGVRVGGGQSIRMDVALEPAPIETDAIVVTTAKMGFVSAQMDIPATAMIVTRQRLKELPVATISEAIAQDPAVDKAGRIDGAHISSTLLVVDGQVMVDQERGRPLLENINSTSISEIQVLVGGYTAEYGNGRAGAIVVTTRDAFQTDPGDRPFWSSMQGIYIPAHLNWFEIPGPEVDGDSLAAEGMYTAYGLDSHEWRTLGSETSLSTTRTYTDPSGEEQIIPSWSAWGLEQNPQRYSARNLQRIWKYRHRAGVDSLGGRQSGVTPEFIVEGAVGIPVHKMAGLVVGGRTTQKAWAQPFYEPKYLDQHLDLKLNIRPMENLLVDVQYGLGTGSGREPGIPGVEPPGIDPLWKYLLDNRAIVNSRMETRSIWAAYTRWSAAILEVRASSIAIKRHDLEKPPYDDPVPEEYLLEVPGRTRRGRTFVDTLNVYWQGRWGEEPYVQDGTYRDYYLQVPGSFSELVRFSEGRGYYADISGNSTLNTMVASVTSQLGRSHRIKVGGQHADLWFGGLEYENLFQPSRWKAGFRTEAYFTDHISLDGMEADLGLRFDEFGGRADFISGLNPARRYWSPRVGLSHPINTATRIFYNYGVFFDTPRIVLESATLRPPKMEQYEVGVDRRLFDQAWLHLTAWNKRLSDGFSRTYLIYLDEDSTSRSQTLRSNTLYNEKFGLSIRAEWASRFFSGLFYSELYTGATAGGGKTIIDLRPAEYERHPPVDPTRDPLQHRTNMVLRWQTPKDFGPWELPPHLAGGWAFTLSWDRQPAYKIFWDPSPIGLGGEPIYVGQPNLWVRGRSMWDVRFEKGFDFGGVNLTTFVDVKNMFNARLMNLFYFSSLPNSGEWDAYVRSLHTSMEDPQLQGPAREGWAKDSEGNILPTGNDMVGDVPEYAVLPQFDRWALWLDPRYVRWGVRIDF